MMLVYHQRTAAKQTQNGAFPQLPLADELTAARSPTSAPRNTCKLLLMNTIYGDVRALLDRPSHCANGPRQTNGAKKQAMNRH